jgi:hypothetical protein
MNPSAHEVSQLASKMREWFMMTDTEAMERATVLQEAMLYDKIVLRILHFSLASPG